MSDELGLNYYKDDRNFRPDDFSENEKAFGLLIGLIVIGVAINDLIQALFF